MSGICIYQKYDTGYGWFTRDDHDQVSSVCILAVYFDREINKGSLLNYRKHGLISISDYRAILHFDHKKGTEQDLKQMISLAKHLDLGLTEYI